jgi:hypothetical protein
MLVLLFSGCVSGDNLPWLFSSGDSGWSVMFRPSFWRSVGEHIQYLKEGIR